ncbi:MAG TPA: YcaO-like family protein, partial [Candidatus Dormibacteraeota bacterium]|nr:YcaO-like family protein [Candidatus Dormibacteraeota bacterium]
QAIRPMSRNLSVSQGKGVTPVLACVSAAMESLELWHAEEVRAPSVQASVGEVRARLPYAPEALPLHPENVLCDAVVTDWITASGVVDGADTLVPRDLVELDYTVRDEWEPPLFRRTSSGLASGNSRDEALLHGLLELVERDGLSDVGARTPVDLASVDGGDSAALLELCARAAVEVVAYAYAGRFGIPTFEVAIRSDSHPYPCRGAGCHPDREVAFCRALTEAAQSRLTLVAGARDDLRAADYADVANRWTLAPVRRALAPTGTARFSDVASVDDPEDLRSDLDALARTVGSVTGFPVLAVDLAREEVGIPVTRVVAPGLRSIEGI